MMKLFGDVKNRNKGKDMLLEIPQGIQADSILQKRGCFQDNVVRRLDSLTALQQIFKKPQALAVMFLGSNDRGIN